MPGLLAFIIGSLAGNTLFAAIIYFGFGKLSGESEALPSRAFGAFLILAMFNVFTRYNDPIIEVLLSLCTAGIAAFLIHKLSQKLAAPRENDTGDTFK